MRRRCELGVDRESWGAEEVVVLSFDAAHFVGRAHAVAEDGHPLDSPVAPRATWRFHNTQGKSIRGTGGGAHGRTRTGTDWHDRHEHHTPSTDKNQVQSGQTRGECKAHFTTVCACFYSHSCHELSPVAQLGGISHPRIAHRGGGTGVDQVPSLVLFIVCIMHAYASHSTSHERKCHTAMSHIHLMFDLGPALAVGAQRGRDRWIKVVGAAVVCLDASSLL